jgi:O-antigen/teichoic acid export membrane protein
MSDSPKKSTLGGLAWLGSSAVLRGGAQLVSLALLSRMLEPADFGIVAAALVVAGLSAVLSELGVNAAIVQAEELTPELEVSAFLLSICMAIALFLLVQLNAGAIAGLFAIPELAAVLPYIAFGFLLRGLAQVSEGKVNRRMDFRLLAFIETSSYVLGYAVVGPLAALQGLGYWSLILAYLAQTSVATIALMVKSPPHLVTLPSRQALKQAFLFGNGITLGRMFSYFAGSGDNFVAARWISAEALGNYGRAYQILVMPAALIGQVVAQVMFPVFSGLRGSRDATVSAFMTTTAAFSMILFPLQALVILFADEVVFVLLGSGWNETAGVLRLLFTTLFCRTAYKINESLLKSAGAVYQLAVAQLIYATAVVVFALFGVSFGLEGIAAGVALAVLLYYVILWCLIVPRFGIGWRRVIAAIAPGFVLCGATIAVAVAVRFAAAVVGLPTLPTAIIAGALAVAATIGIVWGLPRCAWGQYAGLCAQEVQCILGALGRRVRGRVKQG